MDAYKAEKEKEQKARDLQQRRKKLREMLDEERELYQVKRWIKDHFLSVY